MQDYFNDARYLAPEKSDSKKEFEKLSNLPSYSQLVGVSRMVNLNECS